LEIIEKKKDNPNKKSLKNIKNKPIYSISWLVRHSSLEKIKKEF